MKKAIAIVLCLLMLCGCEKQVETSQTMDFYYLTADQSYDTGRSVIEPEHRDVASLGGPEDILRAYLAGPSGDQLLSPFPDGIRLIGYRQEGQTVYLTFSKELASLTNLDLTLACSCITMTCLELTGVEQVCMEAEESLLAGQKSITLDRSSIQLTDNSAKGE